MKWILCMEIFFIVSAVTAFPFLDLTFKNANFTFDGIGANRFYCLDNTSSCFNISIGSVSMINNTIYINTTIEINNTYITNQTINQSFNTTINETIYINQTFNQSIEIPSNISSGNCYIEVNGSIVSANISCFDDRYGHGNLDYFFINASSEIPGFKIANISISNISAQNTTAGLSDGHLLAEWLTINNTPSLTFLQSGVFLVHMHSSKDAGVKDAKIYSELLRRDSLGNEYHIAYTETSPILTASISEDDMHGIIQNNIIMNNTDRLEVKIYANITGSGTAPTVSLYYGGTTDSRLELTTPISAINPVDTGDISGNGNNNQIALFNDSKSIKSSNNLTFIDGNTPTLRINGTNPMIIINGRDLNSVSQLNFYLNNTQYMYIESSQPESAIVTKYQPLLILPKEVQTFSFNDNETLTDVPFIDTANITAPNIPSDIINGTGNSPGIAIFSGMHQLNTESALVWDNFTHRLNITSDNPVVASGIQIISDASGFFGMFNNIGYLKGYVTCGYTECDIVNKNNSGIIALTDGNNFLLKTSDAETDIYSRFKYDSGNGNYFLDTDGNASLKNVTAKSIMLNNSPIIPVYNKTDGKSCIYNGTLGKLDCTITPASATLPYKVYAIKLDAIGTQLVLQNTLGFNPSYTKVDDGDYQLDWSAGSLDHNKMWFSLTCDGYSLSPTTTRVPIVLDQNSGVNLTDFACVVDGSTLGDVPTAPQKADYFEARVYP